MFGLNFCPCLLYLANHLVDNQQGQEQKPSSEGDLSGQNWKHHIEDDDLIDLIGFSLAQVCRLTFSLVMS